MKDDQKILTVISKLQDILKNEYPEVQKIFKNLKKKKDIKHAIQSLRSIEEIKNLIKLVRDNKILQIPEGRELLVYLLTIGDYWTMGIYNNIRVSLETADVNCVNIYATIFMNAWQEANENRKYIETCLENLIYHCLRTQRNSNGREKLGQNLLTFLQCFNLQNNTPIKKMVCGYYCQFIWKYLEVPGSCVRCNAAEVLFSAYPMNLTSETQRKNDELKSVQYLSKQHKAITKLLRDSDINVRAIALKGVFQVLKNFWTTVPTIVINSWLSLAFESTKTLNDPEIRKNVFQDIKYLLRNRKSHSILGFKIPKFLDSLYDPNVDVKLAVLDLFLEMGNCTNINVSNAVPLKLVVHCLEMNSQTEVVSLLHKLLWIRISNAKIEGKILNEIINAGQLNINEFRKFFLQSKDIICYESAVEVLNLLLPEISRLTESLTEIEVNENWSAEENELNVPVKKKSRGERSQHLEELNVSKLKSIHILINSCALLYLVNKESLRTNFHQEINNDIIEKMRHILEKFQDSELNELAILFLSLMPRKLNNNMEEFLQKYKRKIFQQNLSDDMLSSILHLLFKWNEIDFLLDLLPFLIKPDENLQLKLASFGKNVKIDNDLGLKLLNVIFDNNFLCNYLPKYLKKIINLWENLDILEECVETRLRNNDSSHLLLNNNVLNNSFKHYVSVIPKIHSDNFQSEIHFSRIVVWTQEKILQYITDLSDPEIDDLSINLLKSVLNTSTVMIDELKASPKLCSEIMLLYCKCLMKKCGIIFVNFALVTVLALLKYSLRIFTNNESGFLNILVPPLFATAMATLTINPETLVKVHTTDLKILADLTKNIFPLLRESLDLRIKYMSIIFNTAVFCLSRDLKILLNKENIIFPLENAINQKFSFVTEEIMIIISYVEEFEDLCINILNENYSRYDDMDQLSSLMFVQRLIKQRKKSNIKRQKKIKSIVRLIKEQNDNSIVIISTSPRDKFIIDSKKMIIQELMS